MKSKFRTDVGEVEIIRAVKKHGAHDQKTHAGGRGGGGSVNTYDDEKATRLQEESSKAWKARREIEKKVTGREMGSLSSAEYDALSSEDKKKWDTLKAQEDALDQERSDMRDDFLDNAITMKSGNHPNDSDFGFDDPELEKIRDEYVVPDELTLKTNASLRKTGRVTTKVQRFDKMVEAGEVDQPTKVFRGAALSAEQTGKLTPGTSFIDRGFQSTDYTLSGAEAYLDGRHKSIGGEKVMFEYTLQPGLNAVNVGYGEIVLQRGAKVSITGVAKKGDLTVVQAEVSKP